MNDIPARLAALTAKPTNGLLPCPVCDGLGKTWTDGRTHHRRWRAGCPAIGCPVVKGGRESEAIGKWNTRPREAALIALAQEAAGEIERQRRHGFIQGQAWAVAVMLRYELREDELLKESGLTLQTMRAAGVDDYDLAPITEALNPQEPAL